MTVSIEKMREIEAELEALKAAQHRERCAKDFQYYAASCLKIRVKEGAVVPFNLNAVQRKIHEAIEKQAQETGRVRALILKARQPGCSTYVEGRFYWKVTKRSGVRAFILTHVKDATENLFSIANRFHEHCPEDQRPATGRSNAKELSFGDLDSGYRIGTAEGNAVGRSETIQYFHGSEVSRWANDEEHMTGALQAVPDLPDTEVILESTAAGQTGLFYKMCKQAEAGESNFMLIFLPWFWSEEYKKDAPADWVAPEEFAEYGRMYDLGIDQLYWAWAKNSDFAAASGDDPARICWRFRQEYPANAQEAFQMQGGGDSLIDPIIVQKARHSDIKVSATTPIVLGVDVARGGKDRTRIIDRQGRRLGLNVNVTMHTRDTMTIVGRVKKICSELNVAKIFVDVTGVGAGVYDALKEGKLPVVAVNFGETQSLMEPENYFNKRAEMWGFMMKWFKDPAGVQIADDDSLASHLAIPVFGEGASKYDSKSRLQLESKEHMKKRTGVSPDGGDAAALTFAEGETSGHVHQWEPLEDVYARIAHRQGIPLHVFMRRFAAPS